MSKDFWINLWNSHHDMIIAFGKNILLTFFIFALSWVCCRIVKKLIFNAAGKIEPLDNSIARIFYSVARIFIWLVALLIILDLFGVNTSSIVTVIGAAGLAVGLALKNSLSNIAAGLMLLVLRPYHSGDYVDCGDVSGTIKEMGLFSTELLTVDGLFIMVPNSVIINAPVKNYSRNPIRRADIPISIAYGNSLSQGITTLQTLMQNNDKILKDPAPEVLVMDLADNAVKLTLRFWAANDIYWDVYWEIKSQIKPAIENAGLSIPAPQRVITIKSQPEVKKD